MGAHLVSVVLAEWTHVSDRAFRVLVRMALTALDRPAGDAPALVYFAGRELLAMTLRTDGGSEQSRYRTVARAIAELVEAGAIVRADSGRKGHNAAYRLTLTASAQPVDNLPAEESQGGQFSHLQGGQFSHLQGGQFSPHRVAKSATPRTHEENIEELLEERRVEVATSCHPPRATDLTENLAEVIQLEAQSRRSRNVDALLAEASARRARAVAEHRAVDP